MGEQEILLISKEVKSTAFLICGLGVSAYMTVKFSDLVFDSLKRHQTRTDELLFKSLELTCGYAQLKLQEEINKTYFKEEK